MNWDGTRTREDVSWYGSLLVDPSPNPSEQRRTEKNWAGGALGRTSTGTGKNWGESPLRIRGWTEVL